MPPPNADVVRANSAAFSRRDVDAMIALFAPDAVIVDRRAVGWGEFRGKDAIRSYYAGMFDNVDELRERIEVEVDEGDVVVVSGVLHARLAGQPEGEEVLFRYALRHVLSGGLIALMEIFDDAEAAAAQSQAG